MMLYVLSNFNRTAESAALLRGAFEGFEAVKSVSGSIVGFSFLYLCFGSTIFNLSVSKVWWE